MPPIRDTTKDFRRHQPNRYRELDVACHDFEAAGKRLEAFDRL
jgi:hypothetical protein